ncbi:MAG: CoA transferase [Deltaproteobacteria bacterium]|nr:CoA transferase [Deltaproteobacteria bacterium]
MDKLKPGPLDGIVVLDFTWVLAGPHATKTLADMGATVVKVERYNDGANERWLPLRVTNDGVTQSSYSINVNRGKKSICIDFKKPEGMELVHELIKKSDVLVENFAPGVMERLKLDYELVRKIKEDIIYCSISCFGHWGPYSHKPGYDMIAQGASGWSDQSTPPIIAPVSIGDMLASVHATTAICGALIHHGKTGMGQNIDISMMDSLFSMHENTLPWYLISSAVGDPVEPPRVGAHHPGYAPYGIYEGKDGYIAIACLTEPRWVPMVKVMGKDYEWLLKDPRAKDVSTRCSTENAPFIHEQVAKWVMEEDSVTEAERKLEKAGVPCIRCRSIKELADSDPHIKAREMMVTIDQPFIGPMRHYGSPLKMSETPCGVRGHGPFLGEHNFEVFSGVLDLAEDKIKELYKKEILYHEPAVDRLKEKV